MSSSIHVDNAGTWNVARKQALWCSDKVRAGQSVLEIGSGAGQLSHWMRHNGVDVTTLDLSHTCRPDIVGDIVLHDWGSSYYDWAVAMMVFEHIPLDCLRLALSRMHDRVGGVLFSVPVSKWKGGYVEVRLPKCKPHRIRAWLPRRRILNPRHQWEINAQTPLDVFAATCATAGWNLSQHAEIDGYLYGRMTPLAEAYA